MISRKDLSPTIYNIEWAWENGIASRRQDAIRFIRLLDMIDAPYTICIDAPWGEGKTFFVKTVQAILENRNPCFNGKKSAVLRNVLSEADLKSEPTYYFPLYFNAWENDTLLDPLGAIIASISATCEMDFAFSDTGFLEKAAVVVDSVLGLAGHSPGLKNAVETLSGSELIGEYKTQRALEEEIGRFVDLIKAEQGEKIVLFIDELDRCKPEFSIKLLSEIKNFFENEDVIIVLSADLEQLANSLAGVYGEKFDSKKYLERFYDTKFSLSQISVEDYYFEDGRGNLRFDSIVHECILMLNPTMRDMNRLSGLKQIKEQFIGGRRTNYSSMTIAFVYTGLLPVFVLIDYVDPQLWKDIKRGKRFDQVFAFAKDSPAYIDFLNSSIKACKGSDIEISDEVREKHITDICQVLFTTYNTHGEKWSAAYNELQFAFGIEDIGEEIKYLDFY